MNSQFPKPWKPIKGNYDKTVPSGRFRFNDRDAGKVLATTALFQPFVVATSGGLDQLASVFAPRSLEVGDIGTGFIFKWMIQTALVAALQAGSCFLRNNSHSLIRDFGSWIWGVLIRSMWRAFDRWFLSWLPNSFAPWRWEQTDWRKPEDDDKPSGKTVWERWRQRRQQRKQRRRDDA